MAYIPLTTQTSGGTGTASWANQIKDNFAAGVPDIFTTKGDLAIASGADTAARLSVGSDFQIPHAKASATLGVEWSSGVCAHVWQSGPQSILDNTFTKLTFSTSILDVYSFLDSVNNRFVVPVGFPTKLYHINIDGYYTATGTAATYREIEIRINGTARARQSSVGDANTQAVGLSLGKYYVLAAGDYVEAWTIQRSGGALNFNDVYMSIAMIR